MSACPGPRRSALSDIGSHLIDLGEYFCGPVHSVQGAVLSTQVPDRPTPPGAAVGHSADVQVSEERAPVENEDIATFTATFASGAVGTFSVSRMARGLANSLGFEVFSQGGAAAFELSRPAEFTIAGSAAADPVDGYRRVVVGPGHPCIAGDLPMDFPSVGHGRHAFHIGNDAPGIIKHAGDLLTHVHLADCFDHTAPSGNRYILNPAGTPARVHHLNMGEGEVDFDELFRELHANGFDGTLTACVFAWRG